MRLGWRSLGVGLVLTVSAGASAMAHETKSVGAVRLTIGWGEEPAYSGFKNSVDIAVADEAGAPLNDPSAALTVDVTFGTERVSLPLRTADRPGLLRAPLVPTRAGTYSFHVSGTVAGQAIDITSTCSDSTFDCVAEPAAIQFPARDPSTGQLATRLERELGRGDRAEADARTARQAAVGAGALALLAFLVAVVAVMRKGRRRG